MIGHEKATREGRRDRAEGNYALAPQLRGARGYFSWHLHGLTLHELCTGVSLAESLTVFVI